MPSRALTLSWLDPIPLEGCWRGDGIPSEPGLYRIHRIGRKGLDYIGQTGAGSMTLRKRLAMLKGIYEPQMPYRDPHTAAPGLWALRHKYGCEFEVSVADVEGPTPRRRAMEALAIALYRQEAGRSPTLNFGRMPRGYRMSSGNNARLVRAGRRFRGGPTDVDNESHRPGVPPAGPLEGSPLDLDWCGHQWSGWTRIEEASHEIAAAATGLYRILGSEGQIVYLGEGRIRSRLSAHQAKLTNPENRQHRILADATPLECSWVEGPWFKHQRLELETDLIGAFVLAAGGAPVAQFLG